MNRCATFLLLLLLTVSCTVRIPEDAVEGGAVSIFPDYADVTIPRIIAPLNFRIEQEAEESVTLFESGSGNLAVKGLDVQLGMSDWHKIVADSDSVRVTIYTNRGGKWFRHDSFRLFVSDDPIDEYLCYRRIFPGYGAYRAMGIYQRDLATFDESLIFGHEDAGGAEENATCVNCHAFSSCNPSSLHLHIRGRRGGTLVGEKVFNMKNPEEGGPNPTYVNWSNDGRFIAYSAQKVKQWFNSAAGNILEVADVSSEILIYDVNANTIRRQPAIDSSMMVLMPVFSPSTERVYYCAAEPQDSVSKVRYALYSIGFNPATGLCYGRSRCEISAEAGSVSFPRISYDGKYLIYSLAESGYFHAWHKESDLHILNLETGESRALDEINSPEAESCHSWSLSGRWIAFGSRRLDGLYTRPFIAHIDESGHCSKPFILPQKATDYYQNSMFSFNLPEFVSGRVEIKKKRISHSLENPLQVN